MCLGAVIFLPEYAALYFDSNLEFNWQVTDSEGRRRFHGAFSGGFSAGYFNTVGSKEGASKSIFY